MSGHEGSMSSNKGLWGPGVLGIPKGINKDHRNHWGFQKEIDKETTLKSRDYKRLGYKKRLTGAL
jgi:hypothetical protein